MKEVGKSAVFASDLGSTRRGTRMRSIARQFMGTLELPGQQPSKLTLIPQPLVRYQAPEAGVIDGAIFSLAVVTDPEILLVIEARKSKQGATSWHYAAARAHYHHVKLEHQGKMVWEAPMKIDLQNTRAGQLPHSQGSYFIYFPPSPLPDPEDLR